MALSLSGRFRVIVQMRSSMAYSRVSKLGTVMLCIFTGLTNATTIGRYCALVGRSQTQRRQPLPLPRISLPVIFRLRVSTCPIAEQRTRRSRPSGSVLQSFA